MKLAFEKDKDSKISVYQIVDGDRNNFSYVDMIKALIESTELDKPDISKGFSDAEKNSISTMVNLINEAVGTTNDSEPSS